MPATELSAGGLGLLDDVLCGKFDSSYFPGNAVGFASSARFNSSKQTLQLADFLGHNANAVRWQVWTALLTYVLLRYLSYLSKWGHSFTRLLTILRAALWQKFDLLDLLSRYGTAAGHFRHLARPEQAYFAGF